MEGWNKNCFDILSESFGNIVGYDTTCVSQGSISSIRVLISPIKLEPLHDQLILKLDEIQIKVTLKEIKGEFIPSITIVKHFMDVSLYIEYVIFDEEEEEGDRKTDFATSTTRATRQKVEFEFDFNSALGS